MPVVIASIIGGLAAAMGSLIGRALLALGVGFVAYQGFDVLFDWMGSYLQTSFAGFPAEVASFLGFCWIDKAVSMIMSATTVALTMKMTAGTIRKLVMKG